MTVSFLFEGQTIIADMLAFNNAYFDMAESSCQLNEAAGINKKPFSLVIWFESHQRS